jgi:hypothetical protein
MILITIVTGVNLNQFITGGPHILRVSRKNGQIPGLGLNMDLQAELLAHFLQGSSNGANYATGDDEPLGMTRNSWQPRPMMSP